MLFLIAAGDLRAAVQSYPAIAPFDHEVYELAYTVYLANNNLEAAFVLAETAVQQRPDDITWRKRLAQLATWLNRPDRALDEWLFLAGREKSKESVDEALRFARALNRDEIILQLLTIKLCYDDTESLWRELIETSNRLGATDQILPILTRAAQRKPSLFILEQLEQFMEQKGDRRQALSYLDIIIKRYGATPARSLSRARMYYDMGDLPEAYQSLQSAKKRARPSDTAFWQSFSDLAWTQQDEEGCLRAERVLYEGNTARIVDLSRMVIILKGKEPDISFLIARAGWHKFFNQSFFFQLVDIGLQLKSWPILDEEYRLLSDEQYGSLGVTPYFWFARIQVLERIGKKKEALGVYKKALSLFPDDADLMAGRLWLLIETRDKHGLKNAVAEYRRKAFDSPTLRSACAAGYLFLENYQAALPFYEADAVEHRNDVVWLAGYAYVLDKNLNLRRAHEVRQQAWDFLGHNKNTFQETIKNRETLGIAAQLSMELAPGDIADAIMSLVINGAKTEADRETILSWALATERPEIVRKWLGKKIGVTSPAPPPWAEFSLALRENDQDKLSALLDYNSEDLPIRDRVEAARRIGNSVVAMELAFDGLERTPDDEDLRKQYEELVMLTANHAQSGFTFEQRGGMAQQKSTASGLISIYPCLRLLPSMTFITQKSIDASQLGAIPRSDLSGELGLSLFLNGGDAELAVGHRDALNSFTTIRFRGEKQLPGKMNLSLLLGFNQSAPESVPLLTVGVKHEAVLQTSWQATSHDSLSLSLGGKIYNDQGNNRLGTGERFSIDYRHRLMFMSQGLDLTAEIADNEFHPGGQPGAASAAVIPPGLAVNSSFFLPKSSVQVDLGVYTDKSFLNGYVNKWRFFGGGGVIWNSVSGVGYNGEFAVAGRLLGHDRLILSMHAGSDSFGGKGIDITGEIRYTFFWMP